MEGLNIDPNSMQVAQDEYGRPIIIVRSQDKKTRAHGIPAIKVSERGLTGTGRGAKLPSRAFLLLRWVPKAQAS